MGIAVALSGCGGGTRTGARATPEATPQATPQATALRAMAGANGAAAGAQAVDGSDGTAALAASLLSADMVRPPVAPAGGRFELWTAMHHWLGEAGPQTGAVVYDLTASRTLFAARAPVQRPPASVEKLYTSVAALRELGPRATLRTEVLGTGTRDARGVWHGNLYLRGGGDPTLGSAAFNGAWANGTSADIEKLVNALAAAGIRGVTGRVIADASLFDARRGGPSSGFRPDVGNIGGLLSALTYNHGATVGSPPDVFAARVLAADMRRAHIPATASWHAGVTPAGATELAAVSSPPVATLLRLMDVPSDDFDAELLTKQLGARFGDGGTTAGGAAVIARSLGAYDVRPTVVDGSGLSRRDRSSPAQVVQLLAALWGTQSGRILRGALPVVGETGTVRFIARGSAAAGRCRAKTGTLDYVTNLAGYCEDAGGHRLAFAVFIDGPTNWRAHALLSRIVADIARLDAGQP